MTFGTPLLLICLLAVPAAIAGVLWLDRRRADRATAWAPPALLPNMVPRLSRQRRLLPTALLLIGLALLLVGFARPRANVHVSAQQATVILVLDVSGSMAADDLKPDRLTVAKAVGDAFLEKLPHGYRASLVTFSDHAAVAVPPTNDVTLVEDTLARAQAGPQGTALADAVAKAVHVARTVHGTVKNRRPPAVIVVLSDGGQTAGRVSPQQAAVYARQNRIPVTTVLMGTPDGVVHQKLKGGYTEQIQVPAQAQVLETLSRGSGGQFVGLGALDVGRIYSELGSRVGKVKKAIDVSSAAAAGGLAFMLAGGLLSGVWFRRMP